MTGIVSVLYCYCGIVTRVISKANRVGAGGSILPPPVNHPLTPLCCVVSSSTFSGLNVCAFQHFVFLCHSFPQSSYLPIYSKVKTLLVKHLCRLPSLLANQGFISTTLPLKTGHTIIDVSTSVCHVEVSPGVPGTL